MIPKAYKSWLLVIFSLALLSLLWLPRVPANPAHHPPVALKCIIGSICCIVDDLP
ncbi:MAG TPA: hypothetical protein VFA41_16035 [Ktedonobacteraceae bacterium]|jgi:hypothetical protein|nr:hypothetical protein [Ktedonobacteraceae bacterium]